MLTSPSHEAIAEWLRAVRLFNYYDAVKKLGARDASDLVEIEDDELMRRASMPPLARRRFLACARVAVNGLCATASEQARALATAAADQTDALDWMRTLRLNPWLEAFEHLAGSYVIYHIPPIPLLHCSMHTASLRTPHFEAL